MLELDSYPIFAENKNTLKEISKDDSDSSNIRYMTEFEWKAVNFDLVKRHYVNALGLSENNAASVDAVLQFKNDCAFVEFKNGKVINSDLKNKVRDSLLIFSDITGKTILNTREELDFIVVYNLQKNPLPNQLKKGVLQESPSRIAIGNHFAAKARENYILFDLQRYEKLYFRKVHTYSKEQFEEYLKTQQ